MIYIDIFLITFFVVVALFTFYFAFVISNKWSIILGILLLLCANLSFFSLSEYRGYPTHSSNFEDAEFISGYSVEPNGVEEGRIFVWLTDSKTSETVFEKIFKSDLDMLPRAYEIPYTKENKKRVDQANRNKQNGMRVKITAKKKTKSPSGEKTQRTEIQVEFIDPRNAIEKVAAE